MQCQTNLKRILVHNILYDISKSYHAKNKIESDTQFKKVRFKASTD
jgi:hypothetical protein